MRNISTRKIALGVAGVLMLSLGSAFAQDQAAPQGGGHDGGRGGHGGAFRAACGQDMQTYCASAQSREDRHTCMQTNQDKFSDTCTSFMASHMHGGAPQQPAAGQ